MNGDGVMRINSLELKNYKGFSHVELDVAGKSVVLFGVNGAGKSSILNGTTAILSCIINYVSKYFFKQTVTIAQEDIRVGCQRAALLAKFQLEDAVVPYGFTYGRDANKENISEDLLHKFARYCEFPHWDNTAPDVTLPIFASYSVNRSVSDVPLSPSEKHEFIRLEAYRNAVEPSIDFKAFFEWFRNQSDFENQERVNRQDLSYADPAMAAVRTAISNMIPDLTGLKVERSPLRMTIVKHGQTLSIEQLSDGEKCVLALMGDLVRRLAIANPWLKNPLLGTGIVLIDEIELHLHPLWQRKIVAVLHQTFPNIQFIISTHSPQVLGELPEGFLVYRVRQEQENPMDAHSVVEPMTFGAFDTNLVLEDYMQTPSVNWKVSELESEILNLIDQKSFDIAKEKLCDLERLTLGTSPMLTQARILIRRGEQK